MIWDAIVNLLWNALTFCFDSFGLADVTWTPDSSALSFFLSLVRVVCYFFPIDTVVHIIGLIVAYSLFRIIIRLIKTIWDLLPIV